MWFDVIKTTQIGTVIYWMEKWVENLEVSRRNTNINLLETLSIIPNYLELMEESWKNPRNFWEKKPTKEVQEDKIKTYDNLIKGFEYHIKHLTGESECGNAMTMALDYLEQVEPVVGIIFYHDEDFIEPLDLEKIHAIISRECK